MRRCYLPVALLPLVLVLAGCPAPPPGSEPDLAGEPDLVAEDLRPGDLPPALDEGSDGGRPTPPPPPISPVATPSSARRHHWLHRNGQSCCLVCWNASEMASNADRRLKEAPRPRVRTPYRPACVRSSATIRRR